MKTGRAAPSSIVAFATWTAIASSAAAFQAAPPNRKAAGPAPSPAARPAPPPVLEGTVKGPDGKPVEGARLFCQQLIDSTGSGAPARKATTDGQGRFRIELPGASLATIRVEARGLAAKTLERVRPGGTPLAVVLQKGRTIEVGVRDEAGQPVAGARVEGRTGWTVTSTWDATAGRVSATTDARGRARLEGVEEGLATVSASAAGARGTRSNVRPGTSVSLVLRSGASIAGVVRDEGGKPVTNAIVLASHEPMFWDGQSATTDATGRFEVAGVDPGAHTLVAYHPDWAPAVVSAVDVAAQTRVDVAITLSHGVAVTGRLVDAEERPVPGRVRVQEVAGHAAPPALGELLRAEAGPDGRFRVAGVAAGTYAFVATARGFASQRVDIEARERATAIDVGDVVLETGLALRGRVATKAGAPIADATIGCTQSRFDFFSGWPTQSSSNADGSFTLAGLLPGTCDVRASAPGYARARTQAEVGGKSVLITLDPAGALTGVVVEEGNRPVEAYQVRAEPARTGETRSFEDAAQRSVGSTDGRFTLEDLVDGTYVLQVLVPERAPVTVSGLKVAAGSTTDAGVIRAPRGGIVRGVVVDGAGNGILGASVRVRGPGEDLATWSEAYATLTESGGIFEIRGVPEGMASVVARHASFAAGSAAADVDASKGPAEVRVVLVQGGRIEGSAHKRDGTPLAGYTVNVWSRAGEPGAGPPGTMTRPDGTFAVEHVPAGQADVSVMTSVGPGMFTSMRTIPVDVREGETTPAEIISQEILVSGRATRSGAPLSGLEIRLVGQRSSMMVMAVADTSAVAASAGPERMRAVTRDDGSFELIVDGPGRYYASFRSADRRTSLPAREIDVPDAESYDVEIAFTGGVPVSGIVVAKETGQAVGQADIQLNRREGDLVRSLTATSAPDGGFALDADPGDYRASARAEGYARSDLDLKVGPDGAEGLRIELEKGLSIEGRVVDSAGRGLSGVPVSAVRVLGPRQREIAGGRTRPDGTFTLDGLRRGSFTLCAGSALAGYGVRAGIIPGGKEVALAVRPAGKVLVRVVNADGSPAPETWTEITKVDGVDVSVPFYARTPGDANGVSEIPAPAGMLELTTRKDKWKGTARAAVGEGAVVPVELKLSEPDDSFP
jgi:protocatechuate 3,4-dioxygenase beta subunit